ncbi:MAG: outer membrane lipoprotein carrier protein LolA [Bryobacteraceae bacterium]|jgi:outer membrane lipoprotein-sorting protein
MHRPHIAIAGILGIALNSAVWSKPPGDLDTVLDRINRAGAAFRTMSANVRRVSHTAAVNDDTVDSGMILLKRARAKDLRMVINFTEPDTKAFAFSGHEVDIYYPKMQTVDIFDVGKSKALLEQFLLLGFGTSRRDLQASYNLRLAGEDTIAGQKTAVLELVPKSEEVLRHLHKLEMWVADNGYPLQQKFYLQGGDYELATYTNMKINPDLPDSALKLHLPNHVKKEYPQK